jgi:hypothetical protein
MALSLNEEQLSGFKLCKEPLVHLCACDITISSRYPREEKRASVHVSNIKASPRLRSVSPTTDC